MTFWTRPSSRSFWAGTSVNDTASVVASGYAFSEAAGDFAAMVTLTALIVVWCMGV